MVQTAALNLSLFNAVSESSIFGCLLSPLHHVIMIGLRKCRFKQLSCCFLKPSFRNFSIIKRFSTAINVPYYIERGPTDILKELAKTVPIDPTAQHYTCPDDPYFETPLGFKRRDYALCLESGRKSARWIVEKNPEFFDGKIAQPSVEAFSQNIRSSEGDDEESSLISAILKKNVERAMSLYNQLTERSKDISVGTKLLLLQLICFYNCKNKKNIDDFEVKWQQKYDNDSPFKTWKDNGFAEELFRSIESNSSVAYSVLIQGMLKHGQTDNAMKLFNDAKKKELKLSAGVYTGIILNISNITEGGMWKTILELLKEMSTKKIKPNLRTLNAALDSLLKIPDHFHKSKIESALKLLAEFEKLGVEPSLGTYFYLIKMKVNSRETLQNRTAGKMFVNKILDAIGKKNLKVRHASDMLFFPFVMKTCAKLLKDTKLAHRLHSIYTSEDNYKFINNRVEEIKYFEYYLLAWLAGEPIEFVMQFYKNTVPSVFMPSSHTHEMILKMIRKYEAWEYLSTIWEQIKSQGSQTLSTLCPIFLDVAVQYDKDDYTLSKIFQEAATFLFDRMNANANREFRVDDALVSKMIIAFSKYGKFDKAVILFDQASDSPEIIFLTPDALTVFFETCLANGLYSRLPSCLRHGEKMRHLDLRKMAEKALLVSAKLKEADVKRISEWAGVKDTVLENQVE